MNGLVKNWKTTSMGLVAAIFAYVGLHPAEFSPFVVQVAGFLASVGIFGIGALAKDAGQKPT